MNNRTKLELTWIGKDQEPKLEPRILLEDSNLSYHADFRVSENDIFDNRLIFGDNLLALKALEQEFTGKVKCIYIDPPYNTGSAFEHYDDGIEHSLWLNMMRDRLEILHKLLSEDGFIFVQIDNNEMAYLKVLLDEIFGRKNFVNDIIWKRRGGSANPNNRLNNVTDYILWYAKSEKYEITPIFSLDDENTKEYISERFKNTFNGKQYMLAPIERNAALGIRETLRYEYKGYTPQYGWMVSKEKLVQLDNADRLHWNSKGRPNRRVFLEDYQGQPISNLWTDIKVINPMSKERLNFDGQKPEALIARILTLATKPGDLVLDSFAGTGTTGAVAHKMGRKWILIELRDQCHTHIIPRLKKVIDGTDQSGVSSEYNWQGGGGFRYYRLAPSLLEKDRFGNWVISKQYNAAMMAEAMCKHKGFTYSPDDTFYWKQGKSTETDYIFTTTQLITREIADQIQEQMAEDETLLICCKAFTLNPQDYPNITFEKIPTSILKRCEFGRDDYSLSIAQIPNKEKVEQVELFGEENGQ